MKIQIIGLGSPILKDDGVGIHIVNELMKEDCPLSVKLTIGGTGGATLLDMIEPCESLIIVDAIQTGSHPGTIHELSLDDIESTKPLHCGFVHGMDFFSSLHLQKEMLKNKPQQIIIFAVEVLDIHSFSETCSQQVQDAIPEVIKKIKLCWHNLCQ
ncbi:Peptidase A31, hydrogen uptake protein [Candidatus Magnetomorum sp. HK-1]|nr:Peptidase A31, hydrogen uptake protein [Candidatus Magnetomorum sp. HK-1]